MGLCIKVVGSVRFSYFFGKCLFSPWNFRCDNFRLVLGICIVNAVIFIKQYLVNLYWIRFSELLKTLVVIILNKLEKLCHENFFLKLDRKHVNYQKNKQKKHHWYRLKKIVSVIFWFFDNLYFLDITWKSLQASYFLRFFFNRFFLSGLYHCEMIDGTTFGLNIGVFFVMVLIFIK